MIAVEDLKAKTDQVQTKENPVTADPNGEPASPQNSMNNSPSHDLSNRLHSCLLLYFF